MLVLPAFVMFYFLLSLSAFFFFSLKFACFHLLVCECFSHFSFTGVSHFGIGDLQALMEDTHKFESQYLNTLLAPLDKGGKELCRQRSPIHHIEKLNTATGFFQGDEDKVRNMLAAFSVWKILVRNMLVVCHRRFW